MILKFLSMFICLWTVGSAGASEHFLYFRGFQNREALLFRISNDPHGTPRHVPLMRLFTNTKVPLPAGRYAIATNCSHYEFEHSANAPSTIFLSRLQIQFLGHTPTAEELADKKQVLKAWCYNTFENKEFSYENQDTIDVLPGKNALFIAGKNFEFNLNKTEFKNYIVDLAPVSLTSSVEESSQTPFFASIISDVKNKKAPENSHVLSAPINGKLWLFPGKYKLEVNGTTLDSTIEAGQEQNIALGSLTIRAPKNFPFEKRLEAGVPPLFININSNILYQLNTDYVVFAGNYNLNFNGTQIKKNVTVAENTQTVVRTYGAQVDPPDCPEDVPKCRMPPDVTVHVDREVFDAMTIPGGVPFLVFDGNYQYGVEGVRGILKTLPVSEDSVRVSKLGHVKLIWRKTPTEYKLRTNFVRFEARGGGIVGKSLDLMFSKPNDLYLPEGDYQLTYFTNDSPNVSSPKLRKDVSLDGEDIEEVVVPVYVQGSAPQPKEIEDVPPDNKQRLTPIN